MPQKKKLVLRHPIHRPELEFILKAAEEQASMDKARLQSEINLQLNIMIFQTKYLAGFFRG